MSRLLDLSGNNPANGRLWLGTRVVIWNGMRLNVQWPNHQLNTGVTKPIGTCLHWTAADHVSVFNDYGFNIVMDAKGNAYVVKMVPTDKLQAHLWHRNSLIGGFTLCANPEVASEAPAIAQVDLAAQLAAEYHAWHHIDPRGHIEVDELTCDAQAVNIWPTGRRIQVPAAWDHQHYAAADGYGPWRYDCHWKLPNGEDLFEYYDAQLLKYYDALKANTRQFEFADALK